MKKVFLALILIVPSSFSFSQRTSCICSKNGVQGCQDFCESNGSTYLSMTCTTASGPEGYCNCSGEFSHGVAPGSQCAASNTEEMKE